MQVEKCGEMTEKNAGFKPYCSNPHYVNVNKTDEKK